MKLKQPNASRAIAIFLTFAVAQISLQIGLAQGPQFIARLTSVRGNQPILVNGLSAAPGASIVTGATIETLADQTAEINLGSFGTLELGPNTQLRLDYDQNGNTRVTVIRGCAVLRPKKNAEAEILTEQGSAAKNDKNKKSVLAVCYINGQTTVGESAINAISGVQAATTGGGGGGGGLSAAATAGILGAIGAGILIAVLVSRDDEVRPNPSPSSPN